MKILQVIKLQKDILSIHEKRNFKKIAFVFLISSVFDIVGIGAIGYFLLLIIQPSISKHLPIVNLIFRDGWSNNQTLFALGSIILLLFLLKTLIGCFSQKILIEYCYKVGARIRVELMNHYLYAPYSYFIENNTSDVVNQILMYINHYIGLNLSPLLLLIVHSIFITAVLVFLFVIHPFLTLTIIIILGGALLLNIQFGKEKLYRMGLKINETNQQIVQIVQEAFLSLKEIRILGKENYFMSRIHKVAAINANVYGFAAVFQKLPLYFIESIMFILIITLCLIQLIMHVPAQLIVANCGMIVAAGGRLLPSVYQIAISVASIHSSNECLKVIHQSLKKRHLSLFEKDRWPNISNKNIQTHFSTIELKNISYQYPNTTRLALNSISLTIQKGQAIGIVGPSGAGKSTLVDVILRLLEPVSGEILFNGGPVLQQNLWVNHFAYVPQTVHLLDGSILKNITIEDNCQRVDTQWLNDAIKMAQLEEVIAQLPQGIETLIGENGIRLSGGQRQRIALARAFYHQREIIIMDEATSALDQETESEVVNAIKNLHGIKTMIIVAHRYSTVGHCDKIYRLSDGKLVQTGSFESVILNNNTTSTCEVEQP